MLRTERNTLLGALLFWGLAHVHAELPVWDESGAHLPVVVPRAATSEETAAATELARALTAMSGHSWPISIEDAVAPQIGIHIGATQRAIAGGGLLQIARDPLAPAPGEVTPDSFRVRTDDKVLFITAATPEALGYAVAWFLQKFAGARWYSPGERGEVLPRRPTLTLPAIDLVRQPVYVSRDFYALGSPEEKRWGERNGLRGRFEFNHALAHLVTSADAEKNPEWAPSIGGKRHTPSGPADHHWQPNLALPAVAEHAARAAREAFTRDPARPTFSLGINDTVRFDQGPETRALVEPLRYFRGMPDYSPLVFTFMNRAATALGLDEGGRYLGCLAYFWCENPPPFPVHPQVLPYVTTDRSQFHDTQYRAADLELMSRWQRSGVRAYGLWEYGYGYGFIVPRLPHRAFAEAVREGARRGARAYFADFTPQWGFDAFKAWALAQLLWEPERPLADLADDFFHGYYGPAETPMRAFFERCEARWMQQGGAPYWLKFYQQEDQGRLFPADVCAELRGLLTQAAEHARGDDEVGRRVAQTSAAFAVTEAYAEYHAAREKLAALAAGAANFQTIAADIDPAIAHLLAAETRLRAAAAAALCPDLRAMTWAQLDFFTRNDPVPRLLWRAGLSDPRTPAHILANVGENAGARDVWKLMATPGFFDAYVAAEDLVQNGVFRAAAEQPQQPAFLFPRSGALPEKWEVHATPTETGRVALVGEAATRALRVEGGWDTQVFQWHAADPGKVYAASARLRGHSSPGNDAALFLTFLNAEGRVTGRHRMQALPKGESPGFTTFFLADTAPADAAWVGVGVGASRQVAADWLEAQHIGLRAFSLAAEGGRP